MKIYIGADHRGFNLKARLHSWLEENGHEVQDIGAFAEDGNDDYPDFAQGVAEAVAKDNEARGLLICGCGAGMSAAANKVPKVRCALLHDAGMVQAARHDDDLNILALGADFIGFEQARPLVLAFMETAFAGDEKYRRRLDKISALEKKYSIQAKN